jgi:RNA polymerase sigma-70 factor (ECF subfamily)
MPVVPGSDFEAIVRSHQEKVRNICYRFARSREDADDLAQEVFVQAHGSLGRFRREADLSTWIYRIAVNTSLSFLRRSKRKKRLAALLSFVGLEGRELAVAAPPAEEPHHLLEQGERKKLLAWAVDRLPEGQRTAITLDKYEGFDHRDIAAIMGLSVPAVEALLHRAKQRLRDDLAGHFEKEQAASARSGDGRRLRR